MTGDDVAQLLLGSQLVEAGLLDDLVGELQQHVLPGVLRAALVEVHQGVTLVNLVLTPEHPAGPGLELQVAVLTPGLCILPRARRGRR